MSAADPAGPAGAAGPVDAPAEAWVDDLVNEFVAREPAADRPAPVYVVLPGDIDDEASPSGGNAYDRRVCDGLAALGRQVHEIAVPGAWPRPDEDARAALARELAAVPDGSVVLYDGLVACGVPDIVVPHTARLRTVVLVHLPLAAETGLDPDLAVLLDALERETLHAAHAVVTTSPWAARRLSDHHGVDAMRMHVAMPGTEPAPVASGTDGVSRLLCVASITPRKGHDLLIEALGELGDLPWSCEFVGPLGRDTAHVELVRRLIAERDLGDRVLLAGPRTGDALEAAYAAADLLVLPSRAETYGMVVTEALARGVPVLAAAVDGVPDALGQDQDGAQPGMLVPPEDPKELTAALVRWFAEPGLRRRLRAAARRRRDLLPPWEETVRQIAMVLDRLSTGSAGRVGQLVHAAGAARGAGAAMPDTARTAVRDAVRDAARAGRDALGGVAWADETPAEPGAASGRPGDPRFSADWLSLREAADAAARADELLEPLRVRLGTSPPGTGGSRDRLVIQDLGCGTGSQGRWLAGRLPGPQHWVLCDRDPALLTRAAGAVTGPSADGAPVTVETREVDVAGITADDLAGTSLVTASALLDLLTHDEVDRLAGACVDAGCPALLTLSVVGKVQLVPHDPLDEEMAAAFDAHQRRATGGRRLLGPDAVAVATEVFERRGAAVRTAPSPWRLGADESALAAEWLRGWVGAAVDHRPELARRAESYLRRRMALCASGGLEIVVHHSDLLALPAAAEGGVA